jgi:hypothetical protein
MVQVGTGLQVSVGASGLWGGVQAQAENKLDEIKTNM